MPLSDDIKSRLDIVYVIRDYLPLKAAGSNFRGLCPFHHEKTPSFMVSPDKQIWHCFGCGEGGDVFSFVMKIEGLSFVETLRILAPRAGVEFRQEDKQLSSQRNRLLDIMDLAAKYYNWVLNESKLAENARQYLAGRGLAEETIEYWQIGYSPESWDDLINFLKKKGFTDNEIFLAGLSIKKDGTNHFHNRFRGRIMFPISDISGHIVAFSARVSPEKEKTEVMGKYINSPQTMIYDKSRILFGLDKAKMQVKRDDLAIIVEGQMDAITAHSRGQINTVASSGTALTRDQVVLLKRYTNNLSLAFDSDGAGEAATERGMREAMAAGMYIKVIEIPAGKDPDECIRTDFSQWERAVKAAKPMMEYVMSKASAGLDLRQYQDRKKLIDKVMPAISRLGDPIERDYWLKKLSQAADTNEDILRKTMIQPRVEKQNSQSSQANRPIDEPRNREANLAELLIAILLRFPELIELAAARLNLEYLPGGQMKALYRNLLVYYNIVTQKGIPAQVDRREFFQDFSLFLANNTKKTEKTETEIAGSQLLTKLAILGDRDFFDFENEDARQELLALMTDLKKIFLNSRMKELHKLISEAEQAGQEEDLKMFLDEFKILADEIKQIAN